MSHCEQRCAVEVGAGGDVADLRDQLRDFGLYGGTVRCGERAVCRLHRKFAHANENVRRFRQRTFRRLGERNAVVGITDRLSETADVGVHTGGDSEAGGVVLAAVDPLAARQTGHGGRELLVGHTRSVLGPERAYIGVDDSHLSSFLGGSAVGQLRRSEGSLGQR